MSSTIDYYNQNAAAFTEGTIDVDFLSMQNDFISRLKKGASILDFGCGSGRDTKFFLEKGFRVSALDGSVELCKIAEENTGIPVKCMDFTDFAEVMKYDAIWACASILHLPKDDIKKVLIRMEQALRDGGLIYASFKYGDYSGIRGGRFFTDFREEALEELVSDIDSLDVEKMWVTNDVRPGRGDEKWLNVYLRTTRR